MVRITRSVVIVCVLLTMCSAGQTALAQAPKKPPAERPGYKPDGDSEGSDAALDQHNPFKDEEEEDCEAGGAAPTGLPKPQPTLILPQLPVPQLIPRPALSDVAGAGSIPNLDSPNVRAFSGELVTSRTDIYLPGINGLDVAIRRTYKSGLAAYYSGDGVGWETNLRRHLKLNWGVGTQLDSLKLVTGRGRVSIEMGPTGSSGWLGHVREPSKFYHDSANGLVDRYGTDGLVERYRIMGTNRSIAYLVEVRDLNNNKINYDYRSDVPNAPLEYSMSRVTDTLGRTIDVIYDEEDEGAVSGFVVKDSNQNELGRIDYDYKDAYVKDIKLKLLSAVTGLAIPTADQQGQQTLIRPVQQYRYDIKKMAFVNKWGARLTEILSPRLGNHVLKRFEYIDDPQEGYNYQVKRQIDAPDSSQPAVHTYDYEVHRTTYTNPKGDQVIYVFTPDAEIRELHQQIGPNEWSVTTRTFEPCGCGLVKDVYYPNGVHELREYKDNQLTAIWIESSETPNKYLVKRYNNVVLDPENGQYFTAVTHYQPLREAQPGEVPGSCVDLACWGSASTPGHQVIENIFNDQGKIEQVIHSGFANHLESGQTQLYEQQYEYHANGEPKRLAQRVNGSDVSVTTTTLDTAGQIKEVTLSDPIHGGSWTLDHEARDEYGRVIQASGPAGIVIKRDIAPSGHVYRIFADWDGQTAKQTKNYLYNLAGGLIYEQTTTSDGLTTAQTHLRNQRGVVTQSTVTYLDGSTRTWSYGYDANNRRTSTTDWRGFTEGIELGRGTFELPIRSYRSFKGIEQTLSIAGAGSDVGYNAMGLPTSSTDVNGNTSGIFYDEFGRASEFFAEQGDENSQPIFSRTKLSYNAGSFLERIDNGAFKGSPLTPTESRWTTTSVLRRNEAGHVLNTALYEFGNQTPARESFVGIDGLGRVVQSEAVFGENYATADRTLTQTTYDAANRIMSVYEHLANQRQVITTNDYNDAEERVITTTQEGGRIWKQQVEYHRDERRRELTTYEQGGNATRVQSTEHDGMGRLRASVDALGLRTEWDYTPAGDAVKTVRVVQPNFQDIVTHYNYDPATGLLSSTVDPENQPTIHSYHDACSSTTDCFLLPKRTTHSDGRWEEVSTYNAFDQPLTTLDSWGREHTFAYDNFGRLTSDIANTSSLAAIIGPDRWQWDYDQWSGYLLKARVLNGSTVVWEDGYTVNDLGELVAVTHGLQDPQHTHAWGFRYGLGGELREQTYPSGLGFEKVITDYDARGDVTNVHHWAGGSQPLVSSTVNHDGARVDSVQQGAFTAQYDYESDWGRLQGLAWNTTAGTLDGQEQRYDEVGQVIARKRHIDNAGEVAERDDAGRVTDWFSGVLNALAHVPGSDPLQYDEAHRYDLDQVAARDQVTIERGGVPQIQDYDTNAAHFYTLANGQPAVPVHGLIQSDGVHTFHYDAWDQLIEVREQATQRPVRRFTYDSSGRRVLSEDDNGTLTRTVYDGASVAAVYDLGGNSRRTYSGGLMRVTGGTDQTYQLFSDLQGSTIGLSDPAGNILERYRYGAFGERTVEDAQGNQLNNTQFDLDLFYRGRPFDTALGWYDFGDWYNPTTGSYAVPGVGAGNTYLFAGGDPLSN